MLKNKIHNSHRYLNLYHLSLRLLSVKAKIHYSKF
jgi:hypothetical protein